VHAELRLGHGIVVGHNAIALLMRRAGLAGATGRPNWRHAKPDQLAADLVDRNFGRTGPNQRWVTDITEHPTSEGKVYCAVVLDAYSRRVVGWSIDTPDRRAGQQRTRHGHPDPHPPTGTIITPTVSMWGPGVPGLPDSHSDGRARWQDARCRAAPRPPDPHSDRRAIGCLALDLSVAWEHPARPGLADGVT
jgi:hypothetical protein